MFFTNKNLGIAAFDKHDHEYLIAVLNEREFDGREINLNIVLDKVPGVKSSEERVFTNHYELESLDDTLNGSNLIRKYKDLNSTGNVNTYENTVNDRKTILEPYRESSGELPNFNVYTDSGYSSIYGSSNNLMPELEVDLKYDIPGLDLTFLDEDGAIADHNHMEMQNERLGYDRVMSKDREQTNDDYTSDSLWSWEDIELDSERSIKQPKLFKRQFVLVMGNVIPILDLDDIVNEPGKNKRNCKTTINDCRSQEEIKDLNILVHQGIKKCSNSKNDRKNRLIQSDKTGVMAMNNMCEFRKLEPQTVKYGRFRGDTTRRDRESRCCMERRHCENTYENLYYTADDNTIERYAVNNILLCIFHVSRFNTPVHFFHQKPLTFQCAFCLMF